MMALRVVVAVRRNEWKESVHGPGTAAAFAQADIVPGRLPDARLGQQFAELPGERADPALLAF